MQTMQARSWCWEHWWFWWQQYCVRECCKVIIPVKRQQILLNSTIHPQKIWKTRPSNITKSATYIVDLDFLEHRGDVRKDEFGRWNYSGSHMFYYKTKITVDDELEFVSEYYHAGKQGDNIFQLRRIHCKHPSNPNFQRLLAFITGKLTLKHSHSPTHLTLSWQLAITLRICKTYMYVYTYGEHYYTKLHRAFQVLFWLKK